MSMFSSSVTNQPGPAMSFIDFFFGQVKMHKLGLLTYYGHVLEKCLTKCLNNCVE